MPGSKTSERTALPVIQIFGGMGVDDANGPVSLGGPKQHRLLALLTLREGAVARIDWLAEHLWSDDDRPETAAPAIRTYMSRLRQSLPEAAQDWLTTESAGYSFNAPSEALESWQFADLRAKARSARDRADPLTAIHLLDEALALWRGDPFQEVEDSDVARATVEQLQLDRLDVLEERWESALALGRHTQITGELAVFATKHRHRERATRQYALALHRSARTPEALRVIASHREFLVAESGLDPSPQLLALEQAMLANDASLEVEKVGRPLRGYRLLDEIGSGSFSIVWRGVQPSVGREVAIKQIRAELASQPEFIRRFEAEAHLVARIEHPHIVPLIDFWRDPDSAYLVMRLLRGETLERRLDDGPLSVDETLAVASQIGGALAAAHAHNIIHRDVKTSNVMFDESGHVFLTDFGIALEASESTGPAAAFSTGSPAYSAPEQIRREPLGPQADVFSLGVVLFECLTGTLPFTNSRSVAELVERQLHADYPAVTELRPDTPLHISDAVAKATSKSAADRFDSVAEFVAALASHDERQPVLDEATVVLGTDHATPYLGLSAFDEADQENFFGREALVHELVARFSGTGLASRCIGVIGPSGSGKSSVVRAGLSPALRSGAVPGSEQWFATTMIPGSNPFEALEAALLRIAVNPPGSLLDQLKDGKRGVLRCLRRCLDDDGQKIYLVIDQFEELFTSVDAQIADDFLDALAVALENPQTPLRLVFTLRADYYDRPLSHPTFARILDASAVNVRPLSPDELERAIVGPAERLGVSFEPGLVATLAADCIGQPSPLPLLQYALSELFDRRDKAVLSIAVYEEMGGLTGALAARAEAIHEQATGEQRVVIRRIFGRLVSSKENSADLRRRVPRDDVGYDPDTVWALDEFGTARLITFDRDPSTREPTIEVAHEALLREWPRLGGWLIEDRELLRSSEAIAGAADAWEHSGRSDSDLYRGARLENALGLTAGAPDRVRHIDNEFVTASQRLAEAEHETEQGRVRRLRQMVAGIGMVLVLALIAGGVAFNQQRRANDQAELAEEQAARAQRASSDAQTQAQLAAGATQDAESQAQIAAQRAKQAELATLILQSGEVAADDAGLAILLALEADRRSAGPEGEQAILRALEAVDSSRMLTEPVSSFPLVFPAAGDTFRCSPNVPLTASSNGEFIFRQVGDRLVSVNVLTSLETDHGVAPATCVTWVGDRDHQRRFAYSPGGKLWLGPLNGPWEVERQLDTPIFSLPFSGFTAGNRLLFASRLEGGLALIIVDATTGETVGSPLTGPGVITGAAISTDGSFIALSYTGEPGRDAGVILVVDAETGTEVQRHVGIDAMVLGFDETSTQLLIGTAEPSLVTLDLPTGEVASIFQSSATSQLLDVGVRANGDAILTSTTQVEVFDRRTGPTGERFVIPEISAARLRPDGTLFTLPVERPDAEIYELAVQGVGQSIDLAGPSFVSFGETSALVTDPVSSKSEWIDLTRVERLDLALRTPQGEAFEAVRVIADADGLLAISADLQIARWQDGVMTERIALDGTSDVRLDSFTRGEDGTLAVSFIGRDAVTGIWLIDASPGELTVLATIDRRFTVGAAAGSAGTLHTMNLSGELTTYDRSGTRIGVVPTDLRMNPGIPVTSTVFEGLVAFGGSNGAVVVDIATRATTHVRMPQDSITGLAFARNGTVLAIGTKDGKFRTWDLEANAWTGVAFQGVGEITVGAYQQDTDSVWIAESSRLTNLSIDPQFYLDRACELAGRELTQDEWDLYIPGGEPRQPVCR